MDTPDLRKELNEYLSVELESGINPDDQPISADWPYKLQYLGTYPAIINNDTDAKLVVYLITHDHDVKDFAYAEFYNTKTGPTQCLGVEEAEGRTIEQFIESQYSGKPKPLNPLMEQILRTKKEIEEKEQ